MRYGVPEAEFLDCGTLGCQGCAATLSMRLVLKEIGDDAIAVVPACCWSIIDGPWPVHSLKIPVFHTAFETAAVVAAGIKAAKVRQGRDTTVIAWAGDGGTFDIGLQALSGAAERNEDIIYVCYDNEAYMNTGIQRSSATPEGTWTTTTPDEHPEPRPKKDIMGIMAAHRIPYAATACPGYPDDLVQKVEKARAIRGTRFINVLSPCVPGWGIPDDRSLRIARLAVESRAWPLYEVEEGLRYTITREPAGIPVGEYLRAQQRYAHLTDAEVGEIQAEVDRRWRQLIRRTGEQP